MATKKLTVGSMYSVDTLDKAVEGIKRDKNMKKNIKLLLDLAKWRTFVPWVAFR